jgi:molecular chaperone DnaK (HSP70)
MTLKNAGSTRLPGLCLAGLLCVFNTQSMAGALYKWVDENGAVRYSDQLPPQQTSKGHQQLNSQGVVLTTQKAAKTTEEAAIEAEALRQLEKQQREEARLKAIQDQQDRVLLLTFSSGEEIEHARENRIEGINSVINLIEKSVKSTQSQLDNFNNHAQQNYTAKGKEVPGGLAQKIEHFQRKIENRSAQLESKEAEKAKILEKYNQDLERFELLRSASN